MTKYQRNNHIDSLRALSIIAVMLYHYLVRWSFPDSNPGVIHWDRTYSQLFELGKFGVYTFFVVSGFVISMTIGRSSSVLEFFVKRLARIYPAFFTVTIFVFMFIGIFGPHELRVGWFDLLKTLTLFGQRLGGRLVDGAYWTLTVEVMFYGYVALSWVFFRGLYWVGIVSLVLISEFFPQLRGGLLAHYLPFFLAGIAYWKMSEGRKVEMYVLLAASVFSFGRQWEDFNVIGLREGIPQLALIVCTAIIGMMVKFKPKANWSVLSSIGRSSYSTYLIHQNVGVSAIVMMKAMGVGDAFTLVSVMALMLCLGEAIYRFVEVPGQRFVLAVYGRLEGHHLVRAGSQ